MIVLVIFSGMTLLELWLIGRAIGKMFGGTADIKTPEEMAADLSYADEEAVRTKEDFEREQITKSPSAARTVARAMGNKIGLRTRASIARERRERMSRALDLYNQRKAISEEAYRDGMEDAVLAPITKSIDTGLNDYANGVIQYEKDKKGGLASEMRDIRDTATYNRIESFRKARAQEIIEKDLNQRLTKIADLEQMVQNGEAGVTKSETIYGAKVIPIYNMRGAPLKMLTTAISYKDSATKVFHGFAPGAITMSALERMPAIWLDNEEMTKQVNSQVGGAYARRSNAISASYTDVSKNPDKRVGTAYDKRASGAAEPYIVYGWEYIAPGALYNVGDRDLCTPQVIPRDGTLVYDWMLNIWDDLENSPSGAYNEVVLHRYDESGRTIPPDYLVIENGGISEAIKHHAATFGVPIINVERKYYDKESYDSL